MDTNFSSDSKLVIQLIPNKKAGEIIINGRRSKNVAVFIFIPRPNGTK